MITKALTKIFGSRNDRLLKQYGRTVRTINALEPQIAALSDEQLAAKTVEFRRRLADKLGGVAEDDKRKVEAGFLDEVLPEAFAVVREASKRALNMRHFDVQLIGGMVLHQNKIAEMRTGEGKTLVATLPAYLNALTGRGVHIVTVNDYLATRDAEWMGKVYRFLGLTVGVNLAQIERDQKQAAYRSDITYGTNNEFGFDYLRDNMVMETGDRIQRPLYYAIVDEVDSILIDEARTPLIISGQAEDRTEIYNRMNEVAPRLQRAAKDDEPGDFTVDEKNHQVLLTEAGHEHAENLLVQAGLLPEGSSLYEPANINLMHHLYCSLRAHHLYFRDKQYVVQNGEVVIVDEFTGRLMAGRRWSDGLHQAVEAKERVAIQSENQTLASITFQNYFRMYNKLAGMTGTADTEAYEFQEIYGLETVIVPTHMKMVREDRLDQVFRTEPEKHQAVLNDIKDCYQRGQPVLVGTTSVEASELYSSMLKKDGLSHQVLNAKQHASEAQIVAQAGRPKMITIATNMAGRGTDIVLGGNVEKQVEHLEADPSIDPADREARVKQLRDEWQSLHDQVVKAGGLHIIGTERHESRRIDNQLRGRSGRQGDPGSSRFYLSLADPLLRIFAGERINSIMQMLKMPEGEPIEAGMVTRSIESAQRKVEAHNFDIRKQLLEYDNVANDQRKIIYEQRNRILEGTPEQLAEQVKDLRHGVIADIFREHVPEESVEEQWDLEAVEKGLQGELMLDVPVRKLAEQGADDEKLLAAIQKAADDEYEQRMAAAPKDALAQYQRLVLLSVIDHEWREHLATLDHLRQGIHLRGYAQKNPRQEYKREGFELFGTMLETVKLQVTRQLMRVQVQTQEQVQQAEQQVEQVSNVQYHHAGYEEALAEAAVATEKPRAAPFVKSIPKVGRNEPCPCGSGKKYKHCHGKLS